MLLLATASVMAAVKATVTAQAQAMDSGLDLALGCATMCATVLTVVATELEWRHGCRLVDLYQRRAPPRLARRRPRCDATMQKLWTRLMAIAHSLRVRHVLRVVLRELRVGFALDPVAVW